MCGVAGIVTVANSLDLTALGRAMQRAVRHRGPDDQGWEEVHLAGGIRLGLAHTRLSILDLSPAGHQPMHDPASGSWIVYNGEVYNHPAIRRDLGDIPFRGTSDTETILQCWVREGEAALVRLRGMFALALYDGRRRRLWLARDRLGVKPLYVSRVDARTWLFASEVRALLASGLVARRLDRAGLEAYLAAGAVPAPWTLLENVGSLLPGEAWSFDFGIDREGLPEPTRVRYWRPPFQEVQTGVSYPQAVERVRPVLKEAVALRMLADVPVGVFLSGGIDSGAVVATLARQGFSLRTFSVVFGEQAYDESRHARRVAAEFGTDHAELYLDARRVLDDLDDALGAYDQPSIDGLNTFFIARATRQAGVKVALSGLGGDELFAGYPYFRLLARLARPGHRLLARLAHRLLRGLAPGRMQTQKLGALLAALGGAADHSLICRQVMPRDRRALLLASPLATPSMPSVALPPEVLAELNQAAAGLDPVNAQSLMELSLYLANMLLRDTDQMSMAHALEVREPLLDHVLVETVARLPGPIKLLPGRDSRIKGLLADALPCPLPRTVLRRPKKGFVFPWEQWLRGPLQPRVEGLFADGASLMAAGLAPQAVRSLWRGFLAHAPGIRYADILALLHLTTWVRRHGLSLPSPAHASATETLSA